MKTPMCLIVLVASTVLATSPARAQSATSSEEIEALKAQVAALQARLDKLEAEQRAASSTPVAAPAAAAPSSTPAPAQPAVAASPAPAAAGPPAAGSGWFANTTIGGKAYLNASNITERSDGAHGAQDGFQVDVKRFYLTVDHTFDDTFSADLTTDFRYGANGLSKDTALYVKKAYLQAKLSPAFTVRLGAADLPWVPFVENVYGYRFVENALIDRTKYGTSTDYGIHVFGSFGNGLISYAVSAIDGLGYKTRSRSSDTLDLEGRISAQPVKGVILAVGGYTGKLGKSMGGAPETRHRARRFDALAAYSTRRIHAGLEYFKATDWNTVTTAATDTSEGWSAFGSYAFSPEIAVFGRYDWVDPDQRSNAPLKEHYFNVGLNYSPITNLDIALVYKRDKAENGLVPTSNGTIGGAVDGTYDEIGVFTQVKF